MKNSSRCFWGCDQWPVWKYYGGKTMIIRLTFPLTRIMKSQRQWLNHLKKKNCVKIKTMKTKNIDATRINVTQICYYFIEKKVSLNKIILLRCKLVIGFSFFLVHFLTQKVWAEKICIHFHAKGDLPFLGGETATIQTLETTGFLKALMQSQSEIKEKPIKRPSVPPNSATRVEFG